MEFLKQLLKKENAVRYALKKGCFRALDLFSREAALRYLYRAETGERLDLQSPEGFNEKLQWIKINMRDPQMTVCADKYEVRGYVESKGYGAILNELLAVCEDPSDIDWDCLPDRFVVKCTHGSGFNVVCTDRNALDIDQTSKKLRYWLKKDYGKHTGEGHYSKIKPRIIVEKYLGTVDGRLPIDIKIYCYHGRPEMILTVRDRDRGVRYATYDREWRKIAILTADSVWDNDTVRPECLEQLIAMAATLTKPFPFARADFMMTDGGPVFGELTFTPSSGFERYTDDGIRLLGSFLTLPMGRLADAK